jgi:ribonuclease P protein component
VNGTIKSTDEISLLFKTARRITTGGLIVLYQTALNQSTKDGRDPQGRVAFIAGKRLGAAPIRSRAKRRMREAARAAGAPWVGVDVAFVARERTARLPYEALKRDMECARARIVGETG